VKPFSVTGLVKPESEESGAVWNVIMLAKAGDARALATTIVIAVVRNVENIVPSLIVGGFLDGDGS
jgi:hypothetical protein